MVDSETLRTLVLDGYDKVGDAWPKVDKAVNAGIDALPAKYPEIVKDALRSKWNSCSDTAYHNLVECRQQFVTAGRAYSLTDAANQWRTYIAGHISEQPGVVSSGKLMVDDHFTGLTADAYRSSVITSQSDAMKAVVDELINPLADLLDDVAAAIDSYNGAQLNCTIGAFAALALLAVAAATAGAPPVMGGALAAFAIDVAGIVGNAAISEHNLTQACETIDSKLQGLVSDWSGFESHVWPQAVFPE